MSKSMLRNTINLHIGLVLTIALLLNVMSVSAMTRSAVLKTLGITASAVLAQRQSAVDCGWDPESFRPPLKRPVIEADFLRYQCRLRYSDRPDAQIACLMEQELVPQYCKRAIAFKLLKTTAEQSVSRLGAEVNCSPLLALKLSKLSAGPLKYDDPLVAVLYTMAEVAAFNADRYLALNMVPVTVLRKFTSDAAPDEFRVCSAWVEKSEPVSTYKVGTAGCSESDLAESKLFAFLIGQWDTNAGNYLISPDGKLHLIDHERIIEVQNRWFIESHNRLKSCKIEPALLARLKALDLETVKNFWPSLPAEIGVKDQVRYEQVVTDYATELLVRRDMIVAFFATHPELVRELSHAPLCPLAVVDKR